MGFRLSEVARQVVFLIALADLAGAFSLVVDRRSKGKPHRRDRREDRMMIERNGRSELSGRTKFTAPLSTRDGL